MLLLLLWDGSLLAAILNLQVTIDPVVRRSSAKGNGTRRGNNFVIRKPEVNQQLLRSHSGGRLEPLLESPSSSS